MPQRGSSHAVEDCLPCDPVVGLLSHPRDDFDEAAPGALCLGPTSEAPSVTPLEAKGNQCPPKPTTPLRCGFCGKSQKEVTKLVARPGVYICNECVAQSVHTMAPSDDDNAQLLGVEPWGLAAFERRIESQQAAGATHVGAFIGQELVGVGTLVRRLLLEAWSGIVDLEGKPPPTIEEFLGFYVNPEIHPRNLFVWAAYGGDAIGFTATTMRGPETAYSSFGASAGVADLLQQLDIGAFRNGIRVDLRTHRPFLIIGHRSETVDALRAHLAELAGQPVYLNVIPAEG